MVRNLIWALLVVGAGEPMPRANDPTEAVTVRSFRPDLQLERLVALFDGARVPHPAATLAAWKRATRDPKGLGKGPEAAIAMLNPGMVRELRSLDQSRIGFGFDGEGRIHWYAVLPKDDGTFAAVAPALVLTDGGGDAPFLGVEVDRLGPPGTMVAARVPGVTTLASSRSDLPSALRQATSKVPPRVEIESGWLVQVLPDRLLPTGSVARRRAVELVRAWGGTEAEAILGLEGQTLSLATTRRFHNADVPGVRPVVEPGWLEWIPGANVSAVFALTTDRSATSWDGLFARIDRVERADPARAGVAPARSRLNLLALAAGVRPEVDVWPHLVGLSGAVLADARGEVDGALLALHVDDPAAAERIETQVLPRLASRWIPGAKPEDRPEGIRRFGSISDRPLSVTRRGTTVLIGWGESSLSLALAAKAAPATSAAPTFAKARSGPQPQRLGAFWPRRIGGQVDVETPPILWWGWDDGLTSYDRARWEGLRGVVRRSLEQLPLDPPPDH